MISGSGVYGDITYTYDAAGNRTSRVIDFDSSVTTETYTLSSTSNRLNSVADGSVTRSLTYDASGNVIADDRGGGTVYTLVYADHNRLAEIKSGSTVLASYAYGAFGRRLVKTAGSTVTQFHFGPGGQPIAETDATGTTNVEFIWLGGLPTNGTKKGAALEGAAQVLGTGRRQYRGVQVLRWEEISCRRPTQAPH